MLQIDMKMPNNCINCPLTHDYVCLVTDLYLDESLTGAYGEERPDWCPLKEQEAVEPKVIRMNEFGHPVHACGKCGHSITESMNYCSWCGRSVKWE